MTEGMKLSTKTEVAPLLASDGSSSNGVVQLLADRYAKRLSRIVEKLSMTKRIVPPQTVLYYTKAEAAVRALYADAT